MAMKWTYNKQLSEIQNLTGILALVFVLFARSGSPRQGVRVSGFDFIDPWLWNQEQASHLLWACLPSFTKQEGFTPAQHAMKCGYYSHSAERNTS